jgi:hypothetical protein
MPMEELAVWRTARGWFVIAVLLTKQADFSHLSLAALS